MRQWLRGRSARKAAEREAEILEQLALAQDRRDRIVALAGEAYDLLFKPEGSARPALDGQLSEMEAAADQASAPSRALDELVRGLAIGVRRLLRDIGEIEESVGFVSDAGASIGARAYDLPSATGGKFVSRHTPAHVRHVAVMAEHRLNEAGRVVEALRKPF